MDFGEWTRSIRKRQRIDIRTLADKIGVESSTISRVENGRTQVTFLTAIRICEGLEVTIFDFLSDVQGKQIQERTIGKEAVPTMKDVEDFLMYYHTNKEEGQVWLSTLLNKVVLRRSTAESISRKESPHIFVPEDIHKLLFNSPVYRFEIQYPQAVDAKVLLNMYKNGGMLSLADLGEYIRKVRREQHITLASLESTAKVSTSVLSRLESGSIEQIKLPDVLVLDEQLNQEGNLLAMYWHTCSFNEKIARQYGANAEQELKLTALFITTCRWLQFTIPDDTSWISVVRTR